MEFCRRTGLRLPTEMEWLLARAAIWQYVGNPWSWTARNSDNRTHPVGRSHAGSPGLFDMDGNVCEWCSDWFAPWPEVSATNYAGPVTGTERVVCGGCWCGDDWFDARIQKDRLSLPPASRYNNVGFRVCLTPVPAE
jgi:formylglycine-generating enzyme required for sulfatase activity